MVRHFVEERSWTCLYHDVELVGVQVDLLCRDPRGVLTVIEVKTQGEWGMARLSARQAQRLERVCTFLAAWEPIELRLALVQRSKVTLLPVDALTGR